MFAHAFEQRGLGARRGAVDLVGQQDVGEDRSRPELKRAFPRIVDVCSDDVRGEQVGGELNPAELRIHQPGERLGQSCLADAGHVVEQDVAAGDKRDEQVVNHLRFAADDAVEFGLRQSDFFDAGFHENLLVPTASRFHCRN